MIKHTALYFHDGFFLQWEFELPYRLIPSDSLHSDLLDVLSDPEDSKKLDKFWKKFAGVQTFYIEHIEAAHDGSIDVFLKKHDPKHDPCNKLG